MPSGFGSPSSLALKEGQLLKLNIWECVAKEQKRSSLYIDLPPFLLGLASISTTLFPYVLRVYSDVLVVIILLYYQPVLLPR